MEELEFVDYTWKNYELLKALKTEKVKQESLLIGSGLCESSDEYGIEYAFIPTKNMQLYEELIEDYYDRLHVTEHSVDVCKEVFFTSKIEGAVTTLARTQEIHDGVALDENSSFSDYMILGCFQATKYMNLINNRVSEETIRKMWEILTFNACSNQDIAGDLYRTGSVQVGNHVGLNYQLLEDAMTCWINYYNSEVLEDHPFIKAALLHFAFEFIHPFCDGNGRAGRLLMNSYLISRGYDKIKAVSFSYEIDKDRARYDTAFRLSDNAQTDCTYFIEYMLEIMVTALADVVESQESPEPEVKKCDAFDR